MFRAVAGLILAAFLAVPSAASAGVNVGADLSQAVTTTCNDCSIFTAVQSDGNPETGSPIDGVMVSARVKMAGTGASGFVRVLRATGGANEYRNVGEVAISPPTNASVDGIVTEVPARIPVKAGDVIAASFVDAAPRYVREDPDAECRLYIETPATLHTPGTNAPYSAAECVGFEALVAGTVEPDADRDGFGDETQDGCPTSAAAQGTCPAKRAKTACKKKKPKRRAAAAKKCKRKKKQKSKR